MLVQGSDNPGCLIQGGLGGKHGQHGTPGRGGQGGRGGHGYTYVVDKQTHHKPGGFSGSSGRSGRSETSELRDGNNGHAGIFQINVTSQSISRSYPRRYDMRCRHTELSSPDVLQGGNIFQFSDIVDVSSITVENVGGMPTPIQPIQCFVQPDSSYSLMDDDRAHVRSRLAPGAQMTVCDRMSLRVKVPVRTRCATCSLSLLC
jgi:hypothetical protein